MDCSNPPYDLWDEFMNFECPYNQECSDCEYDCGDD